MPPDVSDTLKVSDTSGGKKKTLQVNDLQGF